MTLSPLVIGITGALVIFLSIVTAFAMVKRQQDALKTERKPIPARWKVLVAGVVTILVFMLAVAAIILMLVTPFSNLQLIAGITDSTSLLIWVVLGLIAIGTGLYWVFVKLGVFSWKTFTLDN